MSRIKQIRDQWNNSKDKYYLDELIAPEDVEWLISVAEAASITWKLHKEKKLVPHWPAIYEAEKGYHYISNDIFPTEIMAKEVLRKTFIRLATELPPIMIEVDHE